MIYLLNLNITYNYFPTCFESYESSSGINFKTYCNFVLQFLCLTVFSRTIVIGILFFALQNQSQCLYGIREGCGW